jgi:non-ribosomal peptide synthetase component F
VAIALPRGTDLFVTVWAVFKAGRSYVPLDLDHPVARRAHVLTDSGATLLVTRTDVGNDPGTAGVETVLLDQDASAIAALPADPPAVTTTPADPAYLLYTSGSTGVPKAVVITHHNLTHAVQMWLDHYRLRPEWTYQQIASASFDMFVGESMRAFCSGGRLLVVPRETALDPPALLALCWRSVSR